MMLLKVSTGSPTGRALESRQTTWSTCTLACRGGPSGEDCSCVLARMANLPVKVMWVKLAGAELCDGRPQVAQAE